MKLEKFEVMEQPTDMSFEIKTIVKIDKYLLDTSIAELGPDEFKRLLAENITNEILKELERRF